MPKLVEQLALIGQVGAGDGQHNDIDLALKCYKRSSATKIATYCLGADTTFSSVSEQNDCMLDILISTYEKEEHGIVIIVTINSFHKWKLAGWLAGWLAVCLVVVYLISL